MHVNNGYFVFCHSLENTLGSGFLRISYNRKRGAVAVVEVVVLPEMGLSVVVR